MLFSVVLNTERNFRDAKIYKKCELQVDWVKLKVNSVFYHYCQIIISKQGD